MKKFKKLVASLLAVSSMALCVSGISANAYEVENNIIAFSTNDEGIVTYSSSLPYSVSFTVSGTSTTKVFTSSAAGDYYVWLGITTANSSATVSINGQSYTYTSFTSQNKMKVHLDKENNYNVIITKVGSNTVSGTLNITKA